MGDFVLRFITSSPIKILQTTPRIQCPTRDSQWLPMPTRASARSRPSTLRVTKMTSQCTRLPDHRKMTSSCQASRRRANATHGWKKRTHMKPSCFPQMAMTELKTQKNTSFTVFPQKLLSSGTNVLTKSRHNAYQDRRNPVL